MYVHSSTGSIIPVDAKLTGLQQLLYGPCPALFTQATRNLKVPPGGRSVTL